MSSEKPSLQPTHMSAVPLITPPASPAIRKAELEGDAEKQGRSVPALNSGVDEQELVDWVKIVPVWILSFLAGMALVMYNKYILSTLDFPYPIFLTTCHMGFAVVGTRAVKFLLPNLAGQGPQNRLSWPTYSRSIVPIGILFSASLILSNSAVLLLSVALVQMLKAFVPAAILLVSAALGIRKLEMTSMIVIFVISVGCALAALGEVRFSLAGFVCQTGAVLCESLRVVFIQILLQGQKMDPLTSLSYYAPVCFMLNIILVPIIEGPAPFLALLPASSLSAIPSSITLTHLLLNAALAFSLNILALILIQRLGSLVMSLAGVLKDILLIGGSAAVFGSVVTPMQLWGYGVSVAGLALYYKFTTSGA